MTRALLVITAGCGLAGPAFAQPPKPSPALAQAFADWKARQGKMRTARYVLVGTTELVAPVEPGDDVPPANDRVRPLRATLLLDLAGGRFRIESAGDRFGQGGYSPRAGATTYDGRETRHSQPRPRANGGCDLIIGKNSGTARSDTRVPNEFLPVFLAHGIVPTVHAPPYLEKLPLTPDPEDWVAVGRRPLGGRTYDVFRTEPLPAAESLTDEVWVDPDRGGRSAGSSIWSGAGRGSGSTSTGGRPRPGGGPSGGRTRSPGTGRRRTRSIRSGWRATSTTRR